ncbi:MAG: CDP-glycerol glycerophosphotransferase family protein [Rhodospirillaceae bacterium]|nr:CDP-glycerol glycerophosphotransferase family protein [Rhodospirillaceae bacterium]
MNAVSKPTVTSAERPLRVGFLYNHEGVHQVRHSAVVIPRMLERHKNIQIAVLATSEALIQAVIDVCGPELIGRVEIVKLSRPAWRKPIAGVLDRVSPFSRLDNLYSNRDLFAKLDALIVTEGTSLFLKKLRGLEHLKIIRIDHGAGDRSIGFKPSFGGNDLVLIAGEKQRERFLRLGYLRDDQIAVVGYTKFDAVNAARAPRKKLFPDDKPVVLYNPHPEPKLSSWYNMGIEVLDFFRTNRDYNLIFAPHVMLFRRKLHVSLESWVARVRRDLPRRFKDCPHMLIDTGSPASVDMTYTLAADIYLGDVSSQVYEFLVERRPCVFLNAHGARWQDDVNYSFWKFGPVLDDVRHLGAALDGVADSHSRYRPIQEEAFQDTFDLQPTASSIRAADAIVQFLKARYLAA